MTDPSKPNHPRRDNIRVSHSDPSRPKVETEIDEGPEGYKTTFNGKEVNFIFTPVPLEDADVKRPVCQACGDPVKIVFYSGTPKFAQHCKDCYGELRWGKVSQYRGRRML